MAASSDLINTQFSSLPSQASTCDVQKSTPRLRLARRLESCAFLKPTMLEIFGKKSNKGQAIIEFLVFAPLFLILYTVTLNFFSAINGGINQQKIVRGYFYARIKGNSTLPQRSQLLAIQNKGSRNIGMVAIGWRVNTFSDGEEGNPEAPCYKVTSLADTSAPDACEDETESEAPSKYIRLKTVYGVCSKSYEQNDDGFMIGRPSPGSAVYCTNQG